MEHPAKPILQILISTMGSEGIERIASLPHPCMDGVEYIVSWQSPRMDSIPESLLCRRDFRIFPTDSRGLGANRRDALSHATAPFLLISDDDLSYEAEDLRRVIDAFRRYPECAFLTFRYKSPDSPREYPEKEFDFRNPPKGYFVTSFEIGINRRTILEAGHGGRELRFDPRFGIGAEFCAGEEDMMLADLMRAGHKGRFLPLDVATHTGPTTGMRRHHDPEYLKCKGAVISYIHPSDWPLRMLLNAWRARNDISIPAYCRHWLRGVKARRRGSRDSK